MAALMGAAGGRIGVDATDMPCPWIPGGLKLGDPGVGVALDGVGMADPAAAELVATETDPEDGIGTF